MFGSCDQICEEYREQIMKSLNEHTPIDQLNDSYFIEDFKIGYKVKKNQIHKKHLKPDQRVLKNL